jgi:hypothetical protein
LTFKGFRPSPITAGAPIPSAGRDVAG